MKLALLHALSTYAGPVAGMIEYPQGATGAMSEAGQSACCEVYVLEGELQMNSA